MAIILKCCACEEKFKWDFTKKKYPDYCPLCGTFIGIDADSPDVVMPAILGYKTKANDDVYRQIEKSSEVRMHQAAEMAGCHVSEMSGLKITNMNDRKDCEIAAIPVRNDVTRHMDAHASANNGAQWGFQSGGAELSPDVQAGPFPNAGAKMRTVLQSAHSEISRGSAVSEMHAKETTQPNYRRRG